MSGFGALGRVPTGKHIRTSRSIRTSTGAGQVHWPATRCVETVRVQLEEERVKVRRRLHKQREAC